ncbi:MAG: type II toxin-antitoxin system VapC family toxin [Actinomycetota bacterium]
MKLVFDTSALVKLLVEEEGSDEADVLWEQPGRRHASAIVLPEARSAIRAAERAGRISRPRSARVRDELRTYWDEVVVIGVDDPMARRAAEIADGTGLKGADAIHVATGLAVGAEDTVLVTWDRAMANAATELGLAVAPA